MQSYISKDGTLMSQVSDKFNFVKMQCPIFNRCCATTCRFFNFDAERNPYAPYNFIYAVCNFDDKIRGKVFIARAHDVEEAIEFQKEMQHKFDKLPQESK